MIQSGDVILDGRYAVIGEMKNQGNICTTFEVEDRWVLSPDGSANHKVMKVLNPDKFTSIQTRNKVIDLFQREAESLKNLEDPGIPKVEPDGYFQYLHQQTQLRLHCLVMEKIEGENLENWLEKNQLISERQAIVWLYEIVIILEKIHPDYLHRDIKPSNIMIRPNGKLVLIDFGGVKELTKTLEVQTNNAAGNQTPTKILSPGYTPGEQVNSRPQTQSDFFALGRTFVHLLTGTHPITFQEDSRTGKLNWLEQAPHISDELADLIDWLMDPNWRNRPRNTREIWRQLDKIKSAKRGISSATLSSIASVILNFVLLALLVQGVRLDPGWIWFLFAVSAVIAVSILFPVLHRKLSQLLK